MLDALVIDRSSAIPYYFQLKRALADEIHDGRLVPGDRLPSEPALCDRFGISRTTVRQALTELESEGLLRREKGRGTFVASSPNRRGSLFLQSAGGFFDDARRAGRNVSSRVLRADLEPLPDWARTALEQPEGARGLAVERVRLIDDRAVMFARTYLPEAVGEGIGREDLATRSLYELLRQRRGLAVAGGRRTVGTTSATAEIAELLETEAGAPLLFLESVSWDAEETPFECYHAWHRSDRVKLEIEVRPDPAAR